jgi:hypothetical protein
MAYLIADNIINSTFPIANLATGGNIGSAITTVDLYSFFNLTQTTGGQTITIPSPTDITAGQQITITNTGTASFVLLGTTISPTRYVTLLWNGTAWIGVQQSTTNKTIQQLNATGAITSWNSVVEIGATPLVANITLTLPVNNTSSIGKDIDFKRLDNTAFTVTIIPNGADTVQLNTAASELNTQFGALTVTSVSITKSEQTKNIGISGASTVDFIAANTGTAGTLYSTNIAVGDHIKFNAIEAGNITLDTTTAYVNTNNTASLGRFLLLANKTYRLSTLVAIQATAGGRIGYAWYNSDTGVQIGKEGANWEVQGTDANSGASGMAEAIFTPLINTRVEVRITGLAGLTSIYAGNSNLAGTRATIIQIGTSAIVTTPKSILQLDTAGATAQAATTVAAGNAIGVLWGNSMFTKGSKITFTPNSGNVTLAGGLNGTTYRLTGKIATTGSTGNGYVFYQFYSVTAATSIGSTGYSADPDIGTGGAGGAGWDEIPSPTSYAYITVPAGTTQQIRLVITSSSATPGNLRQALGQTSCTIEEIEG